MSYHPAFFHTHSPSSDYSFKSYLLFMKANGVALNENDLQTYLYWYRNDLEEAKKSNASRKHACHLSRAFDKAKTLTARDINKIYKDIIGEKSSNTTITQYVLNSHNNTITGVSQSTPLSSPSLPVPSPQSQQQQQQQQQQGHDYENKKRKLQRDRSDISDNTTDSSYRVGSDDDSDASESLENKYDYLVGPGVLTIGAEELENPSFSAWISGESDISAIFIDYRRAVINKAEQQQRLNITEYLALNFIFIINKDKPKPPFLNRVEWNNITRTMIKKWPIIELSESSSAFIKKFGRAARTSMVDASDTLNGMTLIEQPATNMFIRSLLNNLVQNYDGVLLDNVNEDTFVKSRVDPIMAAFFKNEDDIVIDGCSTTLASSETARKRFDPGLRGKMADITVSLKEENNISNLIIVEVKPPAKAKGDVDLVKMANMMKNSLDCMHTRGLTSIGLCVMGVIVEGYRCDLYIMDLDYTFLYRLYKLGTFYIPVDRHDFGRLPDLIEHMLTLRECFDGMVTQYQDTVIDQMRMLTTPPHITKKTKPSFISPVRIP